MFWRVFLPGGSACADGQKHVGIRMRGPHESAPTLQPRRPWEEYRLEDVAIEVEARLGMVWLPHAETFLGREAGKWLRQTIAVVAKKKRQERPLTWRPILFTSPLLEISSFLIDAQTWRAYIPDVTDPNFVSIIKERLKKCRNVPVNKVASLVRTDLF